MAADQGVDSVCGTSPLHIVLEFWRFSHGAEDVRGNFGSDVGTYVNGDICHPFAFEKYWYKCKTGLEKVIDCGTGSSVT